MTIRRMMARNSLDAAGPVNAELLLTLRSHDGKVRW